MTIALDNTKVFNLPGTTDQGPQKMNVGGKTESTMMLETPPPVSVMEPIEFNAGGFNENLMKYNPRMNVQQQPMTPDLQMVMNAQNNNQGMMGLMNQASVEPKKGIDFLMERTYII
jgi:hypothetical protein